MMKHARWLILGCLALCLLWSSWAGAQAPTTMVYQGRLLTAAGAPVNGNTSVVFSIYAAATGGSAIWTETRTVSSDLNGVFTIDLGSTTALTTTVFDGTVRYLGIKAGSDAEMTPRQPLSSVPYAMRAAAAPGGVANNSITTAMIQDGAVTTAKILDGTVANADLAANAVTTDKITDGTITAADIGPNIISSIEGISSDGGNINLVPGTGMDITGSPSTITIGPARGGLHPIAYGIISAAGGIYGRGSNNWTVTWNTASNAYEVAITGVAFYYVSFLTFVQGLSSNAAVFGVNSVSGHLLIYPRLHDGSVYQAYCCFMVYDLSGLKMGGEAAPVPSEESQSQR
jgi:hypothetical protein